jgi:hypothetical protein
MHLSSIGTAFRAGGLDEVGRRLYLRVRGFTPPIRRVRFNGVPTDRTARLADLLVRASWRWEYADDPLYESALVGRLREHVRPGDRVTVVGGGHGVTAVVAALATGADGHVDVYEASDQMLGSLRGTLATNGVSGRVGVHHAVVGAAHDVWGETTALVVPPSALPLCDVLMLDCEGAEREILTALAQRPRVLLVETHGAFGAPTADMRALIEAAGYHILTDEIAEAGLANMCAEMDVHVLTAVSGPPAAP